MRFSLRYKILFLVGILLVLAVGFYSYLAASIFREEKVTLLYDLNHSVAVNTASRLSATLRGAADQMRLYVISRMLSGSGGLQVPTQELDSKQLQRLQVYQWRDDTFVPTLLGEETLSRSLASVRTELQKTLEEGTRFWRETNTNEFFLSTRVQTKVGETRTQVHVAVAQLNASDILNTVQSNALYESFLVDPQGQVLLHVGPTEVLEPKDLSRHPLIEKTKRRPDAVSGVDTFQFDGGQWYGAYAPLGLGNLVFLSQAHESELETATSLLMQRSALFAMIVVTATFLVSILFSRRLTRSLSLLAASAQQIGRGEFGEKIEIKTRDEVEDLAGTFNQMTEALRVSREKIEKYNRELEHMVDLRTQQLKDKNLALEEIQQKLLKSTQLAAAGEVAGRTAHEVLNPLTAALARLEQLRSRSLSEAQKVLPSQLLEILGAWETEYRKGGIDTLMASLRVPSGIQADISLFEEDLQNLRMMAEEWNRQQEQFGVDVNFVEQQAQRIQRIVDGMRELIRSSDQREVLHLHEKVEEALLTVSDTAEKQGITLTRLLAEGDDAVNVNGDELVQILINLLNNAFHAVDSVSRDPLITVRTLIESDSVAVEVEDNGVGIAESDQSRLFGQGFTTKAPSDGTGLGLAICRRYARAFGGDVVLKHSQLGEGSCFRLTIPRASTVS